MGLRSFVKWLFGYKKYEEPKTEKQIETEKKIEEIKEEKKRRKVIKKMELNTEIIEKLPTYKKGTTSYPVNTSKKQKQQLKQYNLRNKKKNRLLVSEVINQIENNDITKLSLEEFIGEE